MMHRSLVVPPVAPARRHASANSLAHGLRTSVFALAAVLTSACGLSDGADDPERAVGYTPSAVITSPDAGAAVLSGDAQAPVAPDAGSVQSYPDASYVSEPSEPDRPAAQDDGGLPGEKPTTPSGDAARAYHVEDGRLLDGCGEDVVLRGINHPTMYVDRAGDALPEIARTGANAVRLFWFASHGVSITEAEPAIERSVANGMLPMLEMHDSTCSWNLGPIVDYWTSAEAVAFIEKHESHLLVNLANEANAPSGEAFKSAYIAAIARMRSAGIHVPIVIDGATCGRDYEMLLNNGAALLAADPDHNLIFSAHLYDPSDAATMTRVLEEAADSKLPFIVGEFANKSPPGCGPAIAYRQLIEDAQRLGIGWLAWSWGDNDAANVWNGDCSEFDMTSTFSFDTLSGWGREVAVTDAASITNTSIRPYALTHASCR